MFLPAFAFLASFVFFALIAAGALFIFGARSIRLGHIGGMAVSAQIGALLFGAALPYSLMIEAC